MLIYCFECTERLLVFEDVYTFPLITSIKWKVKSMLLNREWQGRGKWEKRSSLFVFGGGREKEKQECIFHSKLVIKDILKWQRQNGKFSFSLSLLHVAFSLFVLVSSFPFFAPIVEVFILLKIEFVGPSSDVLKF